MPGAKTLHTLSQNGLRNVLFKQSVLGRRPTGSPEPGLTRSGPVPACAGICQCDLTISEPAWGTSQLTTLRRPNGRSGGCPPTAVKAISIKTRFLTIELFDKIFEQHGMQKSVFKNFAMALPLAEAITNWKTRTSNNNNRGGYCLANF